MDKIYEFHPNGANDCNCVCIGKKSAQLIVTGDDKGEVSLWRLIYEGGEVGIDKIGTLYGHTSPVSCVILSDLEDYVVAGSVRGSLRLWGLDGETTKRIFSIGHRSRITCLAWHETGCFFASGSTDTNIKLWEIKKKQEIFQLKNHTSEITALSFTPDGNWLISGDLGGKIKIWDVQKGKLKTELNGHSSKINSFAFHPTNLVLASGSDDKTSIVWDVKDFTMITRTQANSTSINFVLIIQKKDKEALLTASPDCIKMWKYDDGRYPLDIVECVWKSTIDYTFENENDIIAVSKFKTKVSIWNVHVDELSPWGKKRKKMDTFQRLSTPTSIVKSIDEFEKKLGIPVHPKKKEKRKNSFKSSKNKRKSKKQQKWDPNFIDAKSLSGMDENGRKVFSQLNSENYEVLKLLYLRKNNFDLFRNLWFKDETRRIVSIIQVLKKDDIPLIFNILNCIFKSQESQRWITLELSSKILQLIIKLLNTLIEEFLLCAIDFSKIMAKKFVPVINKTLGEKGYDDEKMKENCLLAKKYFKIIFSKLQKFCENRSYGKELQENSKYLCSILGKIK